MKNILWALFVVVKSIAVATAVTVILLGTLVGISKLTNTNLEFKDFLIPGAPVFVAVFLWALIRTWIGQIIKRDDLTYDTALVKAGAILTTLVVCLLLVPKVILYMSILMLIWAIDIARRIRNNRNLS